MRPLSSGRCGSLLAVGLVLAFSVFLAGCAQRSTLPGWRLFRTSKSLLLAEGRRLGATSAELAWASSTLRYAGDNALDHKDHMHIRFE